MTDAYIVAALRTAGARRGGRLKDWHPVDLAARVVDALLERVGADPALVEDVIVGCVGQVGEQSTNIARNVVLASRLPQSVPGTTVDRQCGSSQQALHFAAQAVMSGAMDVVIAGGVESMTRVPMGLAQQLPAEHGFGRYMSPGLQARFPGVTFSQFTGAEMLAEKYGLAREALDRFAFDSHRKAIDATQRGLFAQEIVPIEVVGAHGRAEPHQIDEGIRFDANLEAIRAVKLLREGGRLTAATSSQVCDGASAALLASDRGLRVLGASPLAMVRHMTVVAEDPVIMLEAPIGATRRALTKSGLRMSDIDVCEVNEAFASVPLAWLQQLDADPGRLNVHGGAIALGHPLGASGMKLLATLVHALVARKARYGLQAMCEGGGQANVTIVERA